MKLSFVPLVLSAGLAVSQVSAVPLRVVVVSEQIRKSDGVSFVRVGHAAPPNSHVATMHVSNMQMMPKTGCAGSLRQKANKMSEWIRKTFGLPVPVASASGDSAPHREGLVRILPISPMAIVGGKNGHVAPHPVHNGDELHLKHGKLHVHHGGHRFGRFSHQGSFGQRLTHALMILGPWEGRILAFVIGCGIGVLIRMFWVLALLVVRSARGSKREEEFLADEVIFEEQEHLLPPQYVQSEAAPVQDVKEKN